MRFKSVNLLFSIIIFSLALGGCAQTKPLPVVKAEAQPCPRPSAPKMKILDPNESVCSEKNVEATAANASALRLYAENLEDSVACYKRQAGGVKN